MIVVLDKEIVPITYQSQHRDVCVGSGINAASCEPFHGNETITHSFDYTPFCSGAAMTNLLQLIIATSAPISGLARISLHNTRISQLTKYNISSTH